MSGVAPFTVARLPRVLFGRGRLGELPAVVREFGTLALVLARRSYLESAAWEPVRAALIERGIDARVEVVEEGEPSPAIVDEIVTRVRGGRGGAGADVVVGIGGGSVLDTAKAVAGLLVPGNSVTDHLEGVGPQLPYAGPAVPFVAVPTTAGTGSEATKNAVLSIRGPGGYKRSFRDEQLVARVALVDPDLLASCGPELVAANGMDAVTQLLESYVSLRASPFTDALALSGLEAARGALTEWHAAAASGSGGDKAAAPARERMAYAALLSGMCLAQAGLGAVHGLASPLGAFFPIPHGAACGATLVAATRVNIAALDARAPDSAAMARYATLGRLVGGDSGRGLDDGEARSVLLETLEAWRDSLGVAPLSAYGIAESEIPAIVADSHGSSMRTNPIALSDAEIASILRASL